MGASQIWGFIIVAKDKRCFDELKPKVLEMFGDDVEIREDDDMKHYAFYKHVYENTTWGWFDMVRDFFRENAHLMKDESIADVKYCDEPDEVIRASEFRGD